MTKINKDLLKRVIATDKSNEIYAEVYGSFSLERLDISIYLSEEDTEKFDVAEKIMLENNGIAPSEEVYTDYYRYIQAHNHELFHFYQSLSLPALHIFQKLKKRKLEFETVTMLRFFEQGNSYSMKKDSSLLAPLHQDKIEISDESAKNFNTFGEKYEFYSNQFHATYDGVSLFHIIEGMAHVFSIQLTDTAKSYLPKLENNSDYHIAYDTFYSYVDSLNQGIDSRFKNLLFLYICYYSCQVYDQLKSETTEIPSRLFHTLCSRANLYIDGFYTLLERYKKYSESELRQLNQFEVNDELLKLANQEQIAQIYTFFELIPCIEQDAKKFYISEPKDILEPRKEWLSILESLNIDVKDPYLLVNLSIFPLVLADFWEAYDKITNTRVENNEFTTGLEQGFYSFIDNCRNFLNYKEVLCCEKHGLVKNKEKALHCESPEGVAYLLKELTGRQAIDLFRGFG